MTCAKRASEERSDEIIMLIPELEVDDKLLYRGEGNSSLVIALSQARQVIRLLKSKQLIGSSECELYSVLRQHIVFNETTIRAILPKELFAVPKLVKLSSEQIRQIQELVRDKRPSFRLDKSITSSSGETFALLLPDYCCLPRSLTTSGPVIGVEIKPKQGFLPEEEVLSVGTQLKAHVCRYGLSQFHKLNKGSIERISDYCPLDLFSGCPCRQMTALRALIACPQNNFRVFRDVNYAFGDQTNGELSDVIRDFIFSDDSIDGFCRLLLSALSLRVFSSSALQTQHQICSLHNNATHRCLCDVTDHCLAEGSVLEAILRAQRLDSIDSFLANQMMEAIQQMDNNNEDVVRQLIGQSVPKNFALKERATNESQKEFFARKVWQFLVSLTAKDCSIMIAMQRTTQDSSHVIRLGGQRYLVCLRITDLDQKSSFKIKRTLSNDKRMLSAYFTRN